MKIIKTEKYNKIALKIFIGNCINDLNDEYFQSRVADDATNLAQLVENGVEMSEQDFFKIVSLDQNTMQKLTQNPINYKYYYNSGRNVVWFYDEDKDIEYFYA